LFLMVWRCHSFVFSPLFLSRLVGTFF
jgi:hypothetical protein